MGITLSIILSKSGREELRNKLLDYPPEILTITTLQACLDILDILEEMRDGSLYAAAWNKLQQIFGEQLRQEELDLMDSGWKGVKLEIEDELIARKEAMDA